MLKTERSRRLFKEGGWVVFGQVLTVAGSLFGIRILTELLTPSAYGELALGMTVAMLVNQTIFGPLGVGFTRFYTPAVEHGDLSGYLSSSRKLALSATRRVLALSIVVIIGLIIAGQSRWVGIAIIAFLFSIFSGYSALISGVQGAARQRSIVAIHQGAEPLLRALLAAGLLFWLGESSLVAMLGYLLATFFVLGSQIFFFQKKIDPQAIGSKKKNWQDEIWKYSWPIGVYGIFTWLQLVSDRWSLQIFSTTQEVGEYAVLYQLGIYPMSLITGMAMQFVVPILFQRAGDASNSRRNIDASKLGWYLTWSTMGLSGLAFLIALFFHSLIFRIFVAQEYGSSSYLLPWMILAGGLLASGQSLASTMLARMKTREMMGITIGVALLGVILNVIGAYWLGSNGIVCACLMYSILYLILMAALVKKGE